MVTAAKEALCVLDFLVQQKSFREAPEPDWKSTGLELATVRGAHASEPPRPPEPGGDGPAQEAPQSQSLLHKPAFYLLVGKVGGAQMLDLDGFGLGPQLTGFGPDRCHSAAVSL